MIDSALFLYELLLVAGVLMLAASLGLMAVSKASSDELDGPYRTRVDDMAAKVHDHDAAALAQDLLQDRTLVRELHAALAEVPLSRSAATSTALAGDPAGYALVDAVVLSGTSAELDPEERRARREVRQWLGHEQLSYAHTAVPSSIGATR